MTPTAQTIASRIRSTRKAHGLTQAEIARRTGMHRPNIARIERGRQTPSTDTVARLASAIGCEMADLLDGAVPVQKFRPSAVDHLLAARRLLAAIGPQPGSAIDGVDELVHAALMALGG